MKKLILVLCSFFLATAVYGQGGTREQPTRIQQLQEWSMQPRIVNKTDVSNIDGSPFYKEDWQQGYVIINENSISNTVDLKYSTYTNELLFSEDGKTMALPTNKFKGFVLTGGEADIEFRNGYSSNKHDISSDQQMRLIHDGKVPLLAKEYTKLHRSEDPFTGDMEYTFFSDKDYFVLTANGAFKKVKLKDRDILKALGSHKNELKKYADNNDLDFGEEEDLKKILAKYESMFMADSSK